MDLNQKRKIVMSIAEAIDYFRIVPRLILICYSYLMYEVINWFMLLESPNTEQASLVVTILGVSGAVIGLYQSSGKKWEKSDFDN